MAYKTEIKGKYTLVRAATEMLDGLSAPDLKETFLELNKQHVNHVILDLSGVKYADSSGLSAILIGHRLCRDTGGVFIMFGLKPAVLKIITIAQLNKVLVIAENEDVALTHNPS